MTLESIRINFEQLINDKNNSVIALSGKWGTGKSYLWKGFKEESTNKLIKNSLAENLGNGATAK